MEIYIEYALLENFFVDGTLLFLALVASRQTVVWKKLVFAAFLGAVFAVVFPLMPLPSVCMQLLKFFAPLLFCAASIKRGKSKGRYALTLLLFCAFSFAFAGLLTGVLGALNIEYFTMDYGGVLTKLPIGALFAALVAFAASCGFGVRRLYRLQRVHRHILSCEVVGERGEVTALSYLDTGNTARCKGLPVCFITPDLLYDLFGDEPPSESVVIRTLSGEKRVSVWKVRRIKIGKGSSQTVFEGAYLSPSAELIGREYKLLLPLIE